jgi:hypothetical protein
LPVPDGPTQEDALGNMRAEASVAFGVLVVFDDLLQLHLRVFHAGDVGKSHLGLDFNQNQRPQSSISTAIPWFGGRQRGLSNAISPESSPDDVYRL